MKKEWDTLSVLSHARHDWLNKLQLIKGNLALDKVDRVKEIIDEIIIEARKETKLTNLNLPQFASSLLTCNWENHSFQIEYEVTESPNVHLLDDQLLASWTEGLFAALDDSIEKFQENYLSVTIEPGEDGIRFFFDFSGIITDNTSLMSFLERAAAPSMTVQVAAATEDELSIEVFTMPIQGE
ncbi:sporulation protein [Mesobacillus campisalis]|uniref:Sporulation protein n=1 Tax=Mesobacillus campisalis TaxID=1408103 RepID=A0A0M2SFL0_9BACI|nr:Spo0B C-terminal domain-containing protein [Mesobacillus campisalis]KKK33073.1 sporulation protein [Mesobacillus campisalis]